MQIGQIIRKYRKGKNLTQEEMANRLGVSAPAVNKWENGNSFPDITLLSPIARLLDITPDILLSFREEMTKEEVDKTVLWVNQRLKEGAYEETFQWIKKKVELYPGSEEFMLQMAVILDAHGMINAVDGDRHEEVIHQWYERALDSRDEGVRTRAADALFGFYQRKGRYEEAERCLAFLSEQNPEKKRKQAELCRETGRKEEAWKAYEELLFSAYQRASAYFQGMYRMAMEDGNMEKAHVIARKQEELAKAFDMGEYHQAIAGLDLAAKEEDADAVMDLAERMFFGVDHLCGWMESVLYEHMTFRKPKEEFFREMKRNMVKCFRDDETFEFLRGEDRWQELTGRMEKIVEGE